MDLAVENLLPCLPYSVLALGKTFGIPVPAEGIETYGQLSLLGRPAVPSEIIGTGQLALTTECEGEASHRAGLSSATNTRVARGGGI